MADKINGTPVTPGLAGESGALAEEATAVSEEGAGLRWYQGISRYAWMVLAVAALGWLFDTMDQNIFNLVRQSSMKDILPAGTAPKQITYVGTWMTCIFLLGWGIGGFLFGMVGDRLGRARTMALTIITYAAFTGFTGLTHTPLAYGFCRFMTALGVGGEFAAGASLVAEVFPNRSRAMALGSLQALSAVGNMMAALVTLSLSGLHNDWRWAYGVGAAPAVLVFFIMRKIEEPQKWVEAKAKASVAGAAEMGTLRGLFRDPVLARNTIAGTLLAIAGVGGLWGVGFFSPDLIGKVFVHEPEHVVKQIKSSMFLVQQIGAFFGMFAYAAFSERVGRKPALGLVFVLAFFSVQAFFHFATDRTTAFILAPIMGFCTLGPFAAYSIYFPELFPTRLRATGTGFCYNSARILIAPAPLALGKLAGYFDVPTDPAAGLRTAAAIVSCIYIVGFIGLAIAPETQGKPLQE